MHLRIEKINYIFPTGQYLKRGIPVSVDRTVSAVVFGK
jgi:hypothetical protein